VPPTAGEGSEDATVVRTIHRALVEVDDSIFARLPEQPSPIFAKLYELLRWAAGAFLVLHLSFPPPFVPDFLCRNPACRALHKKVAPEQKVAALHKTSFGRFAQKRYPAHKVLDAASLLPGYSSNLSTVMRTWPTSV